MLRDQKESWDRSDRDFFSAGACHILAYAFSKRFPESSFRPILISPKHSSGRGQHVFMMDGTRAFDYQGFTPQDTFLKEYFYRYRQLYPGWEADLLPILDSLIGETFCNTYCHRLPSQFYADPLPRAVKYLSKLLETSSK